MNRKLSSLGNAPHTAPRAPLAAWRRPACIFAAFLLAVLLSIRGTIEETFSRSSNAKQDILQPHMTAFSWDKITPTTDIDWSPCYENFTCARLSVPLDWQDPSDDLRAYLAIIKYPAKSTSDYRGPVFINPGGPGGSGIWFVTHLARHYQTIVGDNHDIISFDPRGVGKTWPLMDCWGNEQNRRVWDVVKSKIGTLDAHEGVVSSAFTNAMAESRQCARTMGGGAHAGLGASSDAERKVKEAGIGRFVSTANVARDMLEIAEKLGEEKVKYWGFSYGTVLGTTFAAMFPDKIERMVNDGNVDTNQWYKGAGINFIEDAEKVMYAFYHFCHLAGPKNCSFHDSSPSAIKTRLDTLLQDVKKEPIVFMPNSTHERPSIITYSDILQQIQSALYQPLQTFPKLDLALSSLKEGDAQPFLALQGQGPDPFQCDKPISPPGDGEDLPEGTGDATAAVMCGEVASLPNDIDDFQLYVDELMSLSKSAGAIGAEMWLSCVGWDIKAKWKFEGHVGGNTSFPILFIANAADNVTPLSSAKTNSRSFPGSVVLVQDAYGHTTLSTPSRCTDGTIRAYFQNGTLPVEGMVCDADVLPFGVEKEIKLAATASPKDKRLDNALHALMLTPVVSGEL